MGLVVFACVHSAGRSQIAAAFFNALASAQAPRAVAAGTQPAARVHPEVVEAMREVGIDLSRASPRSISDVIGEAELLVTMGCADACPAAPGVARIDWAFEDPKGRSVVEVRRIRHDIRRHVHQLLVGRGWSGGSE